MFLVGKSLAFVFMVSGINASVIQPAQVVDNAVIGASQTTTSSQPSSTSNSESVSGGSQRFQRSDCNAAMYGTPGISSCLDVYKQMTDSDKESVFGDRTRGVFDYPLPYRLSSGKCIIKEHLQGGFPC